MSVSMVTPSLRLNFQFKISDEILTPPQNLESKGYCLFSLQNVLFHHFWDIIIFVLVLFYFCN